MRTCASIILIILLATTAYAENNMSRIPVYSTSMPYYGTQMLLQFYSDDVARTPVCRSTDGDFPLTQADAITAALKWATKEFDETKKWQVEQVSLLFVSVYPNDSRCLYVVELMPEHEMQSLPIGVLTNSKVVAPVRQKRK